MFFFYPWVRFLLSSFLLDSVTLLQAPPGSQLAQQCPLQAVPQISASLGFKPSGITQRRCCWLAPTGHPPNSGTPGSRRTSPRLMLCQRTTLCNPCKASSSCSLRWAPWGQGCHRHHTSRAAGTRTRRHRADKLFNVILIENTSHLLPHSPPSPYFCPCHSWGTARQRAPRRAGAGNADQAG